jgi:glutamate carboxypeptidase
VVTVTFDKRITTFLQMARDRYVAELTRVCAVDSGSYHKPGIDQVQDHFEQRLADLGFAVERIRNEEWGDDLLARRRGSGHGRILLIGHADTVYPVGEAAKRPVVVEGDKLLGPGTCDMKAGILTGLYAIEALNTIGWDAYEELTVLIVSDEEIEQRHSVDLLRTEGARHQAVLTLEAARENGDIVTARKATRWFRIDAHGKAAHAGVEPEKGRNAALQAAHTILALQSLNGRWPGVTSNVGVVRGGTRSNVVAERCELQVDLRSPELATLEEAEAEVARICDDVTVPDVRISIETHGWHRPMEKGEGARRLVDIAVGAASELGFELRDAATGGASDANTTSSAGAPTIDGLGPVGGDDHGPAEWVDLTSIVPRTALLAAIISRV